VSVALVTPEVIAERIFIVRGQMVILDSDLAALDEVPTKQFNQAVKRNLAKFPTDFMVALTAAEWEALRSQFVTLNNGRGQHRKYLYVVRAFVQLRELVGSHRELAKRLADLEQKTDKPRHLQPQHAYSASASVRCAA
jgi:hypothetical protein